MNELATHRLVLRKLGPEHAGLVADLLRRNREAWRPWEPLRDDEFFTTRHQKELLCKAGEEMAAGRLLTWWVCRRDTGLLIGKVNFSGIVRGAFQSCFLGYMMDHEHTCKGYMTEAIEAGVFHMFEKEMLHRVEANIMPRNLASLRVVDKLGFKSEGLSPNYLKICGKWEDHIHMVKLNE